MIVRCLLAIALLSWALAAIAGDEPLIGGHPKVEDAQHGDVKEAQEAPAKKDGDAKRQDKKRAKAAEKAAGAKPAEKANKGGKQAKKNAANAEHEEAVLLFVGEHQPELLELLNRLKGSKEKDYQQAIRELSRDSQRINNLKEKDPRRFEQEVRGWQLDSRIRLLTAKLSLENRPELQEDLKAALAERAELRLAQRKLERERVAARLTKLDQEIAALTSHREEDLKKSFDRLLRAAERARPKTKLETQKEK